MEQVLTVNAIYLTKLCRYTGNCTHKSIRKITNGVVQAVGDHQPILFRYCDPLRKQKTCLRTCSIRITAFGIQSAIRIHGLLP
ncbi:hypothetical protein D3C77_742240 [compost metagenome]